MRRDEQLDDMERTISRLRMDNDAMQEEIKNWRGERDQIRQALDDARTQLAATGCPLCTYINGVVTKSCALHAEVARLKSDIVKVIEADASEVRNLKLQINDMVAFIRGLRAHASALGLTIFVSDIIDDGIRRFTEKPLYDPAADETLKKLDAGLKEIRDMSTGKRERPIMLGRCQICHQASCICLKPIHYGGSCGIKDGNCAYYPPCKDHS